MIATTPEQSARLLACGVDPNTADMGRVIVEATDSPNGWQEMCNINETEWWHREVKASDGTILQPGVKTEHGWSLTALIGLLPKEIGIDGYKYRISIYFESPDEPVIGNQWCLYYKPIKHDEKSPYIDDVPMYSDNLIECAVLMVEWLTRHNYQLGHEVNFASNKTEKKMKTSEKLYNLYRQALELGNSIDELEEFYLTEAGRKAENLKDELFRCVGKAAAYEIDNEYRKNNNQQ